MYPQPELNQLAIRKQRLRKHITQRRIACAEATGLVTRPLAWLDRLMGLWRGLPPLAKVIAPPVTFVLLRTVANRWKSLRTLLRWLPLSQTAFSSLRR